MIPIQAHTLASAFAASARAYAGHPFIIVPSNPDRAYLLQGRDYTYADIAARAAECVAALSSAGYGPGHRIVCLLGNRPLQVILKLACAEIGASWVPANSDYRPAELAYLVSDSGAALLVAAPDHAALARDALELSGGDAVLATPEESDRLTSAPRPKHPPPRARPPTPEDEASLLYTSGTTGRPKGCILSHEYELMVGARYATIGGAMRLEPGAERVYNPLPLFHINAGVVSLLGLMLTGNCQIAPDRFSAGRWWADIRASAATGCHYLGVIVPALMAAPPSPDDRTHRLRFGMGAGVEPTLHAAFEARFGFPLVEIWGMTEMCRLLAASEKPRRIDTRAFGRPVPGIEVRIVDEQDRPVAPGAAGEMVLRHSAETPRKGAYSGYLNLPEETERAWRGGWFHTGDTVRQDADGMLIFVDRKKNIIRRSGENIAAAEVEARLADHPAVAQAAVIAAPDPAREEEVMACIVLKSPEAPKPETADALFEHCFQDLAYFKAPGWIVFRESLPVTGTQKVLKHKLFDLAPDAVLDPAALPDAFDFRDRKKRG
ncbi:MAG: AMP-binding protein [Alphaproteobacteria bacterium]|nr:AMP-binding protein [Alphaproteobacteria bacterium]